MIGWLAFLHGPHPSCVTACAGEIAFLGDAQNKHGGDDKSLSKQSLSLLSGPSKREEERWEVETVAWVFPEPKGENPEEGLDPKIFLKHPVYLSEF
jgi:hypothetical protein